MAYNNLRVNIIYTLLSVVEVTLLVVIVPSNKFKALLVLYVKVADDKFPNEAFEDV